VREFFLKIVRLYQAIRFLFPVQCKFIPSCSQYAKEALEKYPLKEAIKKIFLRLLKCHPLSKGGIDYP